MKLDRYTIPYINENDAVVRSLHEAIREGMWPFKPFRIDVEVVYDVDYDRHWVHAEARGHGWNYWRFHHKELIDRERLIAYPDQELERLGDAILQAFRNRIYVPNDGHHLGEE